MRHRHLAGAALLAATVLAGCISIGAGDSTAPTVYVLGDAGALAGPRQPTAAPVLLLTTQAGDPAADGTRIAYSRRPGERATYELARWSERPERRLVALVQQRLEARGAFAAVVPLGQLAGDWMLALSIQEIVHDVSATPTVARLTLRAEVVDRRSRTLVARKTESVAVPAERNDPAAAVAAFDRAVGQALDALAPWVEGEVRRAAAR
ncbi:MAG: ABC-type transport auxiliary lipoprotein family protein [Betaproteobacteria bacterium]